jgi:hypothetical protein
MYQQTTDKLFSTPLVILCGTLLGTKVAAQGAEMAKGRTLSSPLMERSGKFIGSAVS